MEDKIYREDLIFNMKKQIYTGVDIFKVFAAVGVAAIHSGAIMLNTLGRLSVPFFAIISSLFFFKKYLNLRSIREKRHYLFSYLKRIFYLYLVWQIIYIPLAIIKDQSYLYSDKPFFTKCSVFLWRFIFPGYGYTSSGKFIAGTNGWGVSWYLVALIMGLPLFCLAIKYVNNYIIGIVCILLEIGFICSSGYLFVTGFFLWGILTFLRLFIYIFVGYIISQNFSRINGCSLNSIIMISSVLLLLFLIENVIVYKFSGNMASEELITTVPTSTAITTLALKINPKKWQTIFARNYSTFLYTSQFIFLSVLGHFKIFSGMINGYFNLFMTIVLSFIAFLIYRFINKKFKWHWLHYMV